MELGIDTSKAVYERPSRDRNERIVEQRLAHWLRLNSEIERQNYQFGNERQRLMIRMMTRPIDSRQVFGYFGLMIGSLPPISIVVRSLITNGTDASGILLLIVAAALVAGVIGFQLGRTYVPGALRYISGFSLPNRVALWSVLGLVWGAISGAAGGLFIFLIGSIVAAIVGGIIGSITVPIMVALHSSARTGDFIETKHFLPIAFGVTFSICALILGL